MSENEIVEILELLKDNNYIPMNDLIEIRPSPFGGLGVFAKTRIPKGTIWWRSNQCNILTLNEDQYNILVSSTTSQYTNNILSGILNFCFFWKSRKCLALILDDGRYVNHSSTPNSIDWDSQDNCCSYALRDIDSGEEIVENYFRYDCSWCPICKFLK